MRDLRVQDMEWEFAGMPGPPGVVWQHPELVLDHLAKRAQKGHKKGVREPLRGLAFNNQFGAQGRLESSVCVDGRCE